MRILFCLTGLQRGGAETQVVLLARSLYLRGHTVMLVSMTSVETKWTLLEELKIEVLDLGMKRGLPNPLALLKLRKALKSFDPDVLHSHMVHANIFARCARLLGFDKPIVSTSHSIREGGVGCYILYALTDWMCNLTTHVCRIGALQFNKNQLVSFGKIVCVPNCVEYSVAADERRLLVRRQLRVSDSSFLWLAAGRLTRAKDYPTMLRAFRGLPPVVRERSVLAVAGAGELGDKLRELSNELGLENNVMWLGMREDVPDLLMAADGVLLSSAWEGMPMILLEAALSGKLVVATDVGGVRDIVIPDQTGFLVQPGDCRGLSKVIEGVMNTSNENRKRIGDAARRYAVEAFTPERIIPVWEGLYESLRRSAGNRV